MKYISQRDENIYTLYCKMLMEIDKTTCILDIDRNLKSEVYYNATYDVLESLSRRDVWEI